MKRYLALLLSGLLLFCAACGEASSQPSEADPIRVGVLTDGDAGGTEYCVESARV